MSTAATRFTAVAVLLGALSGCAGKEGHSGPAGQSATVTIELAGANCALGGVAVQVGGSAPSYVCNGPSGASVNVVAEPAGSNCAAGGVAISSGSGAPVYVCHGAAGRDGVAETVTGEPAGSNCTAGGLAVQVGSGTPSYVCNGVDGLSAIVGDAGASCPYGGISVRIGLTGAPSYVCNGAPGANGSDGLSAIVTSAGAACPYGGIAVQIGPSGAPSYVCNGAPGADGLSVVIGDAGANCPSGGISVQVGPSGPASYVCNGTTPTITAEPAGANCAAGGLKIQLGIQAPQYVCNGTSVVLDPCVSALYGPIRDPWGTAWDGSERGLTTFANAKTACEAVGGRLPIATEALRVSAVQAGGVGETYDTNYLWTLDPVSATAQVVARMSDGTFTSSATSAVHTYRCICPPAAPASFGPAACFGPPGSTCATPPGGAGRRAIDASDRAAMPISAALWECSFVHAQLADSIQLIEAIPNGLPNGSGAWLHTSDSATFTGPTLVKWLGSDTAWGTLGNLLYGAYTEARPFRCAGPTSAATPFPGTIADEFVAPSSGLKSEQHDFPPTALASANDICFARGGHLARTAELGQLVQQGLPNGTGSALWTSDGAGYDGLSFLQAVLSWSGVDTSYQFASPAVGGAYKSGASHPFRCVYYPIDAGYTPPAVAACYGGCFSLQVGAGPAMMWLDRNDRLAATMGDAAKACVTLGGHLASERDYVEAVRHLLPNGTAAWLHTSDLAGGTYALAVKWSGIYPPFGDLYPADATWQSVATAAPYRCAWTNELR